MAMNINLNRLDKVGKVNNTTLEQVSELLDELLINHARQQVWVPIDNAPANAVAACKKLDLIRVIKFNDGKFYARLAGIL
jgi:hypothetical protein